MKYVVAEHCGFCYGVIRAVKIAQTVVKGYNNSVATLGELIHNPLVVDKLRRLGVDCRYSLADFKAGDTVVIRSHGVGPDVYAEAQARGLELCDATCPHVQKAQKMARILSEEGRTVIIIGEHKHPEVESIKKWAGASAYILQSEEDITAIPHAAKYGVVSQTTMEADRFTSLLSKLQQARPGDYKIEKTICMATSERQKDAQELAKKVDVVFVFGGYNSANTKHLYEIVKAINPRSYHLERGEEITPQMLDKASIIGITAGASTPQEIIKEAIANMETMESLLGEESVRLHIGMVVEATVVAVTREEVIVNFGYQSEGAVAFDQWTLGGTRETVAPTVHEGDKVTLKVTASENQDGLVVMSRIKAEADQAWLKLPEMLESNKVLTVKGLKAVKGGLTVAAVGVTGFIPASHLDTKRVENIASLEGQEMQAEVLEFDPEKKRLVLSRRNILRQERSAANKAYREERAAKQKEREEQEEAALASLEEGATVKGVVKSVVDFGLFVEIAPYVQGLVHISELSWDRSAKPADLYKVGDEVEVFIKGVDLEKKRVSLSIKQILPDPWLTAVANYKAGDVVVGKVVRFLAFGAIVRIDDKIEGMVHISEIAPERIEKPEDKLQLDQEVTVKILHIDTEHKKVALSITKVAEDAEKAEMNQYINNAPSLSQDMSNKLDEIKD